MNVGWKLSEVVAVAGIMRYPEFFVLGSLCANTIYVLGSLRALRIRLGARTRF